MCKSDKIALVVIMLALPISGAIVGAVGYATFTPRQPARQPAAAGRVAQQPVEPQRPPQRPRGFVDRLVRPEVDPALPSEEGSSPTLFVLGQAAEAYRAQARTWLREHLADEHAKVAKWSRVMIGPTTQKRLLSARVRYTTSAGGPAMEDYRFEFSPAGQLTYGFQWDFRDQELSPAPPIEPATNLPAVKPETK